ncbi:hypothetical protein BDB01DRAFT_487903 [Pilobolus umbonatus]|nr:hypothetical protein BDB01DRAFT_487903 [Pilobolus umbonatus]
MDSYAYLAYPSYGQQNKYAKRNTLVLPYVERFNADTIDTFLFHWSDSQHYLFVRVLESTVAIKPANPRIASLYFNYTSIPQPPTTKTRRSSTQKLQSLIKNFMHIDSDVDSSDSSSNSVKSTDTVTLNDVLSQTPDEDWIHAPCHVTYDKGDFDDHLELHSTQHTLHLTARCYKEKMMFINLLHLTHQWAPPPPPLMPPPIR